MAIYHYSGSIIGRKAGRSSTAAAAYRAGEKIVDERTGIVHDYTRKSGVSHTSLLAPDHAPEWATDRARLWNEVEAVEKRKDSQLAREYTIALPHELTREQQIELVESFARAEFVALGMVADVGYHNLPKPGQAGKAKDNGHAHVMLTMREIGPDGFGKKARQWNDSDLHQHWREAWEQHANAALEVAGSDARIDHRSLAAQGIDRPPQIHEGPTVAAIERRNQRENGPDAEPVTERRAHNIEVAAYVESQIALARLRSQIDAEHDRAQAEMEAMQLDEVERDEPPADYIERRAAEIAAEREARENREAEQARAAAGLEARRQAQARRIVESIQSPGTTAGVAELREQARALRQPKPAPVIERAVREAAEAEALQNHPVTIRQRDGSKRQTSLWALDRQATAAESEVESLRGQLELDEIAAERERAERQGRGWLSRLIDRTPDEPPELVEQRREVERAERRAAAKRHQCERIADELPSRPTVAAKLRQAGDEAVEQAHERHAERVEQWEDRQAVADLIDGVADRAERKIEAAQAKDREAIREMRARAEAAVPGRVGQELRRGVEQGRQAAQEREQAAMRDMGDMDQPKRDRDQGMEM